MATALTLATKFTAVDKFTPAVRRMAKGTKKFANTAVTQFAKVQRAGRKLGKGINNLTGGLGNLKAIAAGLVLGVGISAGADAVVNFEKSIVSAGAKFRVFEMKGNKGIETMKALRAQARKTGAETQFSAGEAAQGLNFLAMAGFNAEQAIAALPGVVNLATASETDLATATDIATDTLGAFGLATKNAEQQQKNLVRVSDVLAKVTTTSNVTMEQLFETIQDAAPVFKNAGGEIEDFAAIAGIMANSGIKGTKAGTAIKNMMIRLQAPTAAITKTLNKMGVNIDDGTGKMKSMSKIVGEIIKNTNKWTSIQRNAAFATIFGKQAIAGSTITVNAGAEAIDEYTKSLMDAEGTSKQMSEFMQQGLFGVIKSMQSAFESVAIAIGETFKTEIDQAIKSITAIARGAKHWITQNKELIKTIANVAVWVGKILIAIKAFTIALGVYKTVVAAAAVVQNILAFAVNATLWPILLIIAVIAAVIAIIMNWGKITKWFAKIWGKFTGWISETWGKLVSWFKNFSFVDFFKSIGQSIIDFLLFPLKAVLTLVSKIPGKVGAAAAKTLNKINDFTNITGEVTTTNEGVTTPVNPAATVERVRTERIENNNQLLGIEINDKSGMAGITQRPDNVNVNLTQTLGAWE